MSALPEWQAPIAAGIASTALIAAMLATGRTGALDHPNQRSLHAQPVPRSGGLGVLAATAIGIVVAGVPLWLGGVVSLLALVSWLDDQRNLPIAARFAAHVLAATATAWSGDFSSWGLAATAAAMLAMVWMTNLYNFMDGSNGLAGGMSAFGFAAFAVAAKTAGADDLALVAGCITAGALGFLVFNFHPARIFLGDVGSIPLGFLAAALGLDGVRRGLWPLWFPPLVFSPFAVDATVTLLRRAWRGDKVWQAHRDHYYQRLIRMGWSHRRLALSEYVLMASVAILALTLRSTSVAAQSAGLALSGATFLALMILIDRAWQHHVVAEQRPQ